MKIKLKGAYANPASGSPATATTSSTSAGTPTIATINNLPVASTSSFYSSAQPSYTHTQVRPAAAAIQHQQQQYPHQQQRGVPSPANNHHNRETSASTSSSQADDAFLNAPLDLPESSGDEYEDPRLPGRPAGSRKRRRHFASTSPRPSRRRKGSRPIRGSGGPGEQDDDDEDDNDDGQDEGDYDEDEDEEGVKVVVSSPRRPPQHSQAGGPKKRGRPPLPRDAMGNIIKINTKGKGRSEDEGTPGLGGDDSLGDGDDSNLIFDDEDEDDDDSVTLQSGMSTPGGTGLPGGIAGGARKRGNGVMFGSDGKKRAGAVSSGIRSKQVKHRNYAVDTDELVLPIDEEGEKKVNALGQLQGGREYKAPTFTTSSRECPDRLYMLAIDAARCAGFRDSLYFFRRNPLIHKLNCSQEEKELLIAKGRLHINLKSRQVTIVTARNCYRIFGARFIKNGKNVTDDYYEAAALARGAVPGSPAYIESYDPEIDNTTLAMPKVGNFAKPLGAGRPAYMKIARAFEFLQAPLGSAPPDGREERERAQEKERLKREKEEEEEEAADAAGRGYPAGGTKKSAFRLLKIPTASGYKAIEFGLVNGAPSAQFGGNGIPPFGDQWEKSKARKPAPWLNGYNWMLEFAKITSRTNSAILAVRKEYNAYHSMTLGGTGKQSIEEEQEGVWEVSGDEDEYETMEEYRKREGLEEVAGEDEEDDRKRGRTPEPSIYANGQGTAGVKAEASEDNGMNLDNPANSTVHPDAPNGSDGPTKKRRRRRSPVRGFYDAHTRAPQVRLDTQPSTVLEYEKLNLVPYFEDADSTRLSELQRAAALAGVGSVEYAMKRS